MEEGSENGDEWDGEGNENRAQRAMGVWGLGPHEKEKKKMDDRLVGIKTRC